MIFIFLFMTSSVCLTDSGSIHVTKNDPVFDDILMTDRCSQICVTWKEQDPNTVSEGLPISWNACFQEGTLARKHCFFFTFLFLTCFSAKEKEWFSQLVRQWAWTPSAHQSSLGELKCTMCTVAAPQSRQTWMGRGAGSSVPPRWEVLCFCSRCVRGRWGQIRLPRSAGHHLLWGSESSEQQILSPAADWWGMCLENPILKTEVGMWCELESLFGHEPQPCPLSFLFAGILT